MRKLQPYVIGVLFVLAGVLHFLKPRLYEAIVPPFLPAHREIVRVAAGWGLIALLLAVFPANIYMAIDPQFQKVAPAWALYARLPLQFLLIWWIYAACIAEP